MTNQAAKTRSRTATTGKGTAAAPSTTPTKVAEAVKEAMLTVTVTRHDGETTTREEQLEVHNYQTAPAYVKVKHGATRQPIQYEGIRVDVEISRPCYTEEIPDVLKEVAALAYNTVYDELEALMGGSIEPAAGTDDDQQQEEQAQEAEYDGYTYDELANMDLAQLKAAVKAEPEIKVPRGKANDEDTLFNLLVTFYELEAPEEEEEQEDGVTYEEVANYSDDELVAFAKENKVTIPRNKSTDMDFIFDAVVKQLGLEPTEGTEGEDDGSDLDSGEQDGEPYTYDELFEKSDEELIELAEIENISIDADVLEDSEALFAFICEALGVEIPEGDVITAEGINGMELADLNALVEEFKDSETPITVSAREAKSVALFRKAAIKSLGL